MHLRPIERARSFRNAPSGLGWRLNDTVLVDQVAEREEIGGKSGRKRIPLGDVATANLSKPSETLSESGPVAGQGQGQ